MPDALTAVHWVDALTGELVTLDVPDDVSARIATGEPVAWHGADPVRTPAGDAIAALNARNDQITARLDELVDTHPDLKAV